MSICCKEVVAKFPFDSTLSPGPWALVGHTRSGGKGLLGRFPEQVLLSRRVALQSGGDFTSPGTQTQTWQVVIPRVWGPGVPEIALVLPGECQASIVGMFPVPPL